MLKLYNNEKHVIVNRLRMMKVLSMCVHMYNVWSYILHVSNMQTNAEYVTTVSRMSVYYI